MLPHESFNFGESHELCMFSEFLKIMRLAPAPRRECFYLEVVSTLHSNFTYSFCILSAYSFVMFSVP